MRMLKLAVCCGAPLLVLVFLAAGGSALLGAAGGILSVLLPILALLACPLAMLFLMRGMRPGAKSERAADATSAAAGERRER